MRDRRLRAVGREDEVPGLLLCAIKDALWAVSDDGFMTGRGGKRARET